MIFIALGANLPGPAGQAPRDTLIEALAALPAVGATVRRRSGWWRTAPVPPDGQPWYVNAVAEIETALDPAGLLAALHAVEARFGRVRHAVNTARSCDLDLLDYHGLVLEGRPPDPVLPHPRLQDRLFVLRPLAELAPDWVHPARGRTLAALIAALPPGQACAPLEGGRPLP